MKLHNNIKKVFDVFQKNYQPTPLEVFKNPYKILVSTLLSSRTKDETTLLSSQKLFKKAPTIQKLNKLNKSQISRLIYPVGFYKTKSKHLKSLANKIIKDFNGQIPNTREELMKLAGVGRKTANLVLNRAFNKPAIAVDTHVHRISNLLGWVNTKTAEKTEIILSNIIPKSHWSKMNKLFVSIGRQYKTKKKLVNFLKKNKLI